MTIPGDSISVFPHGTLSAVPIQWSAPGNYLPTTLADDGLSIRDDAAPANPDGAAVLLPGDGAPVFHDNTWSHLSYPWRFRAYSYMYAPDEDSISAPLASGAFT